MLTPIDKSDIPDYRGAEPSPLRLFADQTVAEFVKASSPGECAEVTGAPVGATPRDTSRLANALRDALWRMGRDRGRDMRAAVRVTTRGGRRVFMERVKE